MDYKTQALAAYEQDQVAIAEQNAKDLETHRKNGEEWLFNKLNEVLGITNGVTIPPIKSINDTIYAHLDGLLGVRFYVYHWFDGGGPELTIEPTDNPHQRHKIVRSWAHVGEILHELETFAPIQVVEKELPQFEGLLLLLCLLCGNNSLKNTKYL